MPNVTNSIGGVSRIEFYNDEGQVIYATDVPEELANDPRVYAHDTAEPYGVLNNYDTSEQVLWNVVDYVGNRVPVIERAREMSVEMDELYKDISAMHSRLNKIAEHASEHPFRLIHHISAHSFYEGKVFEMDQEKFRTDIVGSGELVYHKDDCACELMDMRCYCWEPYYTGSQLEVDLQALVKKMNDFFYKYNWKINAGRNGILLAKPPQELMSYLDRDGRIGLKNMRYCWNGSVIYMENPPIYYTFEESSLGHTHTNVKISMPQSVTYINLP